MNPPPTANSRKRSETIIYKLKHFYSKILHYGNKTVSSNLLVKWKRGHPRFLDKQYKIIYRVGFITAVHRRIFHQQERRIINEYIQFTIGIVHFTQIKLEKKDKIYSVNYSDAFINARMIEMRSGFKDFISNEKESCVISLLDLYVCKVIYRSNNQY